MKENIDFLKNSLSYLQNSLGAYKTQSDLYEDKFIITIPNPKNSFLNLSIIFEFNEYSSKYEYYFGINKEKLSVLFLEDNMYGVDSYDLCDDILKLVPKILNEYYFVIFTGLADMPNMIIADEDFKLCKKELSKVINQGKSGVLSDNYTGCSRVDFYKFDGTKYHTIFPNQVRFKMAKTKNVETKALVAYWTKQDAYSPDKNSKIKIGYLEYDESKNLFIKSKGGNIDFAMSFDQVGSFRIGYVFGETYEQILDVNGHPVITICNEDVLNLFTDSLAKEKLAYGLNKYFAWVVSYASGFMLDTGKYNSYISNRYYEFVFNKFNG